MRDPDRPSPSPDTGQNLARDLVQRVAVCVGQWVPLPLQKVNSTPQYSIIQYRVLFSRSQGHSVSFFPLLLTVKNPKWMETAQHKNYSQSMTFFLSPSFVFTGSLFLVDSTFSRTCTLRNDSTVLYVYLLRCMYRRYRLHCPRCNLWL